MDEPRANNPHWVGGEPAWDIYLSNGEIHESVTTTDIRMALRHLVKNGDMGLYESYIDVVRDNHIKAYNKYHTQQSTARPAG